MPQLAQRQIAPSLGDTRLLKGRHEVVGQTHDFQIKRVSREHTGGNFSQGKVFSQFANAWLHAGPAIIVMPHAGGCERQITDPGPVGISFQSKERGLRFTGFKAPASNKIAPRLGPTLRSVFTFTDLPTRIESFITQSAQFALEPRGQA